LTIDYAALCFRRVKGEVQRQTKSEGLFLEYCALRGHEVKRISSPADGGRFADYEMLFGDTRAIAEVKELQASPEDERIAKIMQENRFEAFQENPGRRVRTHLEDAERQLRRYEQESVPCLVVLYENIVVNGFRPHPPNWCLSPYQIDVGMYGLQAANLRLYADGRTESLGDTRGGKRTLRHEHRDNVSAIAVLCDYAPDHGLFLIIYHNYYAKTPLPKTLFAHPKDFQLGKPNHPELCPGAWDKA
jgi:hypothetical protein